MKRITLLAFVMMFGLLINAQSSEDTIRYSILSNNPHNMRDLSLGLVPIQVDFYSPNFSFGYMIEADYHYDNLLIFGAKYRGAYTDRWDLADDNIDFGRAKSGSGPGTSSEIYGQFNFLSRIDEDIYDVTLKATGRTEYFMEVPGKKMIQYGARVGYVHTNLYVFSTTNVGGNMFYFVGDDLQSSSSTENIDGGTTMKSSNIFIGLNKIKKRDIVVNASHGYGKKTECSIIQLFADLMLSTNLTLEDMLYQNKEYNVDNDTPKSPVGFRVGYTERSMANIGAYWSAELGARPGPGLLSNNLYIMVSAGVNLGLLK
jgi:hypothetical protein